MRPEALVLYATNTFALYEEHKRLARENATPVEWGFHVRRAVLPLYRKELNEPFEGMSREEIDETARELAAYYVEHVTEEGA